MRGFFKNATEVAGNVKIESIAAIAVNPLPFDPWAKVLSGRYQLNWHSLLTGADEDDDTRIVVQA